MNPILDTSLSCTIRCVIFLVISFVVFVVLQSIRIFKAPPDIPWVELKNRRFFPKLRACLSELTAGQSMLDEGYEKVSTDLQREAFPAPPTSILMTMLVSTANTTSPSSSPACPGTPSSSPLPTPPGSPNNPTPFSAETRPSTNSWVSDT